MAVKIYSRKAEDGCRGCCYDRGQGAEGCPFVVFCMAHFRKDNQSIIFTRDFLGYGRDCDGEEESTF